MFKDSLFKKIENKTNINKETILKLASKLKQNDLKDENNLKEIIKDISKLTGKEVSKEKEDKIINAIINDKVPTNFDEMI
jgi:predicted transcriptional regulator